VTEPLDLLCPRCGAPREPEQEYCLECGLKLPATTGRLARARRAWVKRLGWYPGDWVWTTLLALVVAVAGAAVAIVATRDARSSNGNTVVATLPSVSVTLPAVVPTRTVDTTTLPTAPEPTTTTKAKPKPPAPPPNGRTPWPAGRTGWTVVLESLPATQAGLKTAQARANRAAGSGLPDVGVIVSSRYSTLHPGYYVIFSGIYDTRSQAESTLRAATGAGFSSSYVRQIAR
jgi:hypothetical protein